VILKGSIYFKCNENFGVFWIMDHYTVLHFGLHYIIVIICSFVWLGSNAIPILNRAANGLMVYLWMQWWSRQMDSKWNSTKNSSGKRAISCNSLIWNENVSASLICHDCAIFSLNQRSLKKAHHGLLPLVDF
jgi:hypothetical protein